MTATPNHGFQYMSGMIQSWNKFCFTGGYVEGNIPSMAGLCLLTWTGLFQSACPYQGRTQSLAFGPRVRYILGEP